MAIQPLDAQEWESVLQRMHRYHYNIGQEIKKLIQEIRQEMKQELVPVAEDRANYGKIVKKAIRSMWSLEYEIEDIQVEFAKSIGAVDINNLTDDFVEEVMLQSKPLQGILLAIRRRQKAKMEEIKKEYGEHLKDLEPLTMARPPKPQPKPQVPEEKKPEEARAEPAKETSEPVMEPALAPEPEPASEPEPAVDPAMSAQPVEASA